MTTPCPAVTKDFKTSPYWWDQTPLPSNTDNQLSKSTDVLIIGAGLSGLMVGLHLARAGVEVTVVDAATAGEFASTRNFGAIGRTIRLKFSDLVKQYDIEFATRVYSEAREWVNYTSNFIQQESISCRFERAGRIVAAHSQAAYDASAQELDFMHRYLDVDTTMLNKSQQYSELGSDVYHGCAVYGDVGHLDPSMYHAAVYKLAVAAGVKVIEKCQVIEIRNRRTSANGKFQITTEKGEVFAEQLVVATNAETPRRNATFRYFHRRTLPVSLYSAVSEPLDPDLMAQIFPNKRTILETRRLYTGIRPIVGQSRFLVVGQHLKKFTNESLAANALRLDLIARYPSLNLLQFSHVWYGIFCITFDWLPHLGTHNGIHYLHGLNGAGVPACGYLGQKLAMRILNEPGGDTVFADRNYPKRFGYGGNAWFMPLVGNWYRALDQREAGMTR